MKSGTKADIFSQKHSILEFPGELQPFLSVCSETWFSTVWKWTSQLQVSGSWAWTLREHLWGSLCPHWHSCAAVIWVNVFTELLWWKTSSVLADCKVQRLKLWFQKGNKQQVLWFLNIPQGFCLIYQEFQGLSLEVTGYALHIQEMPGCPSSHNLLVNGGWKAETRHSSLIIQNWRIQPDLPITAIIKW